MNDEYKTAHEWVEELSENYTGIEDDYENYVSEGLQTMTATKTAGLNFKFKVKNTTGKGLKLVLIPGHANTMRLVAIDSNGKFEAIGGHLLTASTSGVRDGIERRFDNPDDFSGVVAIDAVADDGIVYAEDAAKYLQIIPSNAQFSYRNFIREIQRGNSMRVKQIGVVVNHTDAYGAFTIMPFSSLERGKEFKLMMDDFLSETQQLHTKITINTEKRFGRIIQIDKGSILLLDIPGQANGANLVEQTIQFDIESVYDTAAIHMKQSVASFGKKPAKKLPPTPKKTTPKK